MAVRNLLRKDKLDDFKNWINDHPDAELIEYDNSNSYQLLRFWWGNQQSRPHIIYDNHKSVHLSIENRTAPIVRKFLKYHKLISKAPKQIITIHQWMPIHEYKLFENDIEQFTNILKRNNISYMLE